MEMTYFVVGGILLALSLTLIVGAILVRRSRGLASGSTLALDSVTITSKKLGLIGRPDRIVRQGRRLVIEEWKSQPKKIYPSHRVQLGVYFLLVEEHYRVRPDHGLVVLRDGRRERVENTNELRTQVLNLAGRIRDSRQAVHDEISVRAAAWLCRGCGQRSRCRQAKF